MNWSYGDGGAHFWSTKSWVSYVCSSSKNVKLSFFLYIEFYNTNQLMKNESVQQKNLDFSVEEDEPYNLWVI